MNCKIKHVFLLCMVLITSLSHSLPETCPVFISLGKDCEAAGAIKDFKLRLQAYPFDWNVTENFSDVCHALKNRFADFLNPAYLRYDGNVVINTKYTIFFNHDFPANPLDPGYTVTPEAGDQMYHMYSGSVGANYLDYVSEVTEKYTRRISRLLALLDSQSTIVFIRTHITPEETKQFIELMETHYPLVDYTLLVTHTNPLFNYDWNIPRVINHYWHQSNHTQMTWMHPDEWKTLLTNLGFGKWKTE